MANIMFKSSLNEKRNVIFPQWVTEHSNTLDAIAQKMCIQFSHNNFNANLSPVLKDRIQPLFTDPHTHYIQVFEHGQMIALAMVSFVAPEGVTSKLFCPVERTALFSMVVIKASHRGAGLYQFLNEERLKLVAHRRCTELLLHTQNQKVMRSMMTLVSLNYPQSHRAPLEVVSGMYGNDIAGHERITLDDMAAWGYAPVEFNPTQGDACRLRWRLNSSLGKI